MTGKMRERLLRSLVSGLLNSDLGRSELKVLAAELRRDPTFIDDLSFAIGNVASMIAGPSPKGLDEIEMALGELFNPNLSDRDKEVVAKHTIEEAIDVVNRRRLSKRELLEIVFECDPKFPRSRIDSNMTVRELINAFMMSAAREGLERFLTRLGIHPGRDPYLEGIGKKR
jgi:hypothetical protein